MRIDSYIVSYPKIGRTWLYKILSLYSNKVNTKNYIKNRKIIKFDNKYIKFIHDCSDPSPYPVKPIKFRNQDLVHKKDNTLRDPREIIVSFGIILDLEKKHLKKE